MEYRGLGQRIKRHKNRHLVPTTGALSSRRVGMAGPAWKSLPVPHTPSLASGVVWLLCGCFVWSSPWEYWHEDGVFSRSDDKADGFGDTLDGC
jgi:hypothetical protein